MENYANYILKQDGIRYSSIIPNTPNSEQILNAVRDEAVKDLGYYLAPHELFAAVAERARNLHSAEGFILEDLRRIFSNIEKSSMALNLNTILKICLKIWTLATAALAVQKGKNNLIARVITTLNNIDFNLSDVDGDVLGDAYEYLIGEFAGMAGKKAGEFYTPKQVSTILTQVVATDYSNGTPRTKERIKSVYDPTCGSGSLLLRFQSERIQVGTYYGQEINRSTYNLARMNMILHGVHYRAFDLHQEDTIEHPAEAHQSLKFEAVVANPPFSAKWSQNEMSVGDACFSDFPRLPPASKADYCFVMHMLHHLADNGVMAVILPHGALFRGAAEGEIRQFLIETKNWLDTVIGLPANVFYGTSIPACILVFKKCREADDDIMFIDASQHFEKVRNRNILRDEDVSRIVDAFRQRSEVERFARPVPLAEIEENDFNLNIPRYVDTSEPEEEIDLETVADELKAIEDELKTQRKSAPFCKELSG